MHSGRKSTHREALITLLGLSTSLKVAHLLPLLLCRYRCMGSPGGTLCHHGKSLCHHTSLRVYMAPRASPSAVLNISTLTHSLSDAKGRWSRAAMGQPLP